MHWLFATRDKRQETRGSDELFGAANDTILDPPDDTILDLD